tara:strand:- start:9608 stop:10327 length:720 start_codon:yes stop_codon:yes gene_type:complete
MKKTLIILVALSIVFTTVYWLDASDDIAVMSKNTANIVKNGAVPSKNLLPHPPHASVIKVKPIPSANSKVTVIESSDNTLGETPFAQSATAETVLKASGKLRENLRGEVYLAIDNDHIAALEAGDTLELDIPFFDIYQDVAIESTKFDSRGNKTINASFLMNEDIYTTTITLNKRAIYGHIETPHGIYSLAGNGQYAWMAEVKDLVHGAIPDQMGGNTHDGSADPQPIIDPKPIEIKDK